MTTLNLLGWEAGDATEVQGSAGTFSVQGTTKRTGQYALRCNPASSASGYNVIGGYAATGVMAVLGRTAQTFYTFHVRFEDIPSGTTEFAGVFTNSNSPVARLRITSAGVVTLVGATTSATVATLVADTWYRVDIRVTSNGTCGAAVDGGTEQTCTGNNLNQDRLVVGRTVTSEAFALDAYYDDVLISDSGFPGAGEIRRLDPDGDGTYTGWTGGSGTTFAVVDDDVPGHDSDSTYIQVPATGDNTARTFSLESSSSGGVAGTIVAVRAYAVVRTESNSGASTVGVRVRNGSTDVDTSGAVEWTSSYVNNGLILDTDPNGGGAWTSGGLDTLEIGVFAGTLAQAQRCTKLAAMVWCAGASGTTEFITPSGTVTSAGALVRQVNRTQSGTVTSTGSLVRAIARSITGAIASVGALSKQVTQSLTGTITSSGTLANVRTSILAASGTITSAGALVRQANTAVTGTVTSSGSVVSSVAKQLAGTVTSGGSVAWSLARTITGTITSSGALTNLRVAVLSASGSIASVGSLIKQVNRSITGAITSAGSLAKAATQSLSGTITSSSALTQLRVAVLAVSGSIASAGVLARSVTQSLSGTVASTGALVRQANTRLTGTVTSSGTLAAVRTAILALSGSIASTGALAKSVAKSFAGVISSLVGALTNFSDATVSYGTYTLSESATTTYASTEAATTAYALGTPVATTAYVVAEELLED